MTKPVSIRLLQRDDIAVFAHTAPGVFDNAIDLTLTREFLDDPRHLIAVALADDLVIGMATALHYVHPDKPAQLWINETGVADGWRRRGVATALMRALFARGGELGCRVAWLCTERSNEAALALYRSLRGTVDESAVLFEFDL